MLQLPPFLTLYAGDDIRLAGHRIGIYHIVTYYNEGYTAEMLAQQFPTLELALIHKVIAFYLENQAEIDAYCAATTQELDRQMAAAPKINIDELRERLARRQRLETAAIGSGH